MFNFCLLSECGLSESLGITLAYRGSIPGITTFQAYGVIDVIVCAVVRCVYLDKIAITSGANSARYVLFDFTVCKCREVNHGIICLLALRKLSPAHSAANCIR